MKSNRDFERAVVLRRDGAGVGGAVGIFRAATVHVRTRLRGRAGRRDSIGGRYPCGRGDVLQTHVGQLPGAGRGLRAVPGDTLHGSFQRGGFTVTATAPESVVARW